MWIGFYGNCCVSPSRCPARWVAPSSGACFYGDYTLRARTTHAPWDRACGVGFAHTRVSGQIRRREARREGGTREARRFFPAPGALGQPGAGHGGRGGSLGFQLLSPPPSQFKEGYLKTGTQARPGEEEEGAEPDGRPGLQATRGGASTRELNAERPSRMGLRALEMRGDTLSFSVLLLPPAEVRKWQGRGLSREGGVTSIQKQSFEPAPPPRWGEMRGEERKEVNSPVPALVSFSPTLLKWVFCWLVDLLNLGITPRRVGLKNCVLCPRSCVCT